MLKIVDVHLSESVNGEYVVLQNHGLTTISLHGWLVTTDAYTAGNPVDAAEDMYAFAGDILIKPYARVVLFTGPGTDGWRPTTDGKWAYVAYWGRSRRVWSNASRVVLLQPACSRKIGVAVEAPPVPVA
ncbi:MAG: lamin tail domain-containing protein [Armatimonadetes bacterium]|nr:lamin tail domain-containing protein [Armatimonadota bacterium]